MTETTAAREDYDLGQHAATTDLDEGADHESDALWKTRSDWYQRGYDDVWFHTRNLGSRPRDLL